jgi:hypothetical protein
MKDFIVNSGITTEVTQQRVISTKTTKEIK